MVSVVITTYNRRAFLREAVLSALGQSYGDKEVIVVDDGSQDGSFDVVRDLPVRYEWKKNGGVSSARNFGMSLAEGHYLSFLDADDLWKREKLAVQLARMEAEGFAVSYTDEIWLRNGQWLNQKKRHRKYSGDIYEQCLPLCIISPSSAVIERRVFDEAGLFDESLPVCEDYDMWLRITSRYPALFVPLPLIVKRGGHADQLSRAYQAMDKYRIIALLKMLDSRVLNDLQRKSTRAELQRKCMIVAKGAQKRGKTEEAAYYFSFCQDPRSDLPLG